MTVSSKNLGTLQRRAVFLTIVTILCTCHEGIAAVHPIERPSAVLLLSLFGTPSVARRGQAAWFNPSGAKQCTWIATSKKYSCDYKNLADIPTDIPAETEILGLSNNQIQQIANNKLRSSTGTSLTKLRILDLSSNKITFLGTQAFSGTPNLNILDIHNNHLQNVDTDALAPLKGLRYLHMQQNRLQTLQSSGAGTPSYFRNNAQLVYLDLSENRITSVQSDLFSVNPFLSHLNMRSNFITTVQTGTFDNNKALQTVDLYDNKIAVETGGTYKQLFATRLSYLAQSSPPTGNITKAEDGQLPWRRADCGVCVNQNMDCINIRNLYGISRDAGVDFATTFPTAGKYTSNATVDLRDICVGSCGTCMVGLIEENCWDFENSRCL
jgi:hypothetical protein